MVEEVKAGDVLEWRSLRGSVRGAVVDSDDGLLVDTGVGRAFPLRDIILSPSLKRIDDGILHRN